MKYRPSPRSTRATGFRSVISMTSRSGKSRLTETSFTQGFALTFRATAPRFVMRMFCEGLRPVSSTTASLCSRSVPRTSVSFIWK